MYSCTQCWPTDPFKNYKNLTAQFINSTRLEIKNCIQLAGVDPGGIHGSDPPKKFLGTVPKGTSECTKMQENTSNI